MKYLGLFICAFALAACWGHPDHFTNDQMFSAEGVVLWKDMSTREHIGALRNTLRDQRGSAGKEISEEHLESLEKCMDEAIRTDAQGQTTIGSAMGGCSLKNAMQGIGADIVKSMGRGK
jgi:hypothetical protein